MKYRLLKKANVQLSEIGFGCMPLGMNNAENEWLIRTAFDGGINYFDTADIYQNGFNEETVGRALRPIRSKVFLATKVGNRPRSNAEGWDWVPRKSYILEAVDKSLSRLDTDYIDLYQLHGGTIEDDREEVVEAFEFLKHQGKILHWGISSIRPNVVREYVKFSGFVSDMLQYSLLDRRPEEELLDLLEKHEVGVVVRGVLAKGFLANKDLSDYLDYSIEDIDLLRNKMSLFSIEKMTKSQVALKWLLAHSAVTSAVVGIRTMAQLNDVLGLYNSRELSTEEVRELSEVLSPNFYKSHR
jgi:aryl-alcohol dehydrogenase-like predicted oxidoreductase